jgi:hypothetical protein
VGVTTDPTGRRAFGLVTETSCPGGGSCSGMVGLDLRPPQVVPAPGAALVATGGAARGIAASAYLQTQSIPVNIIATDNSNKAVNVFPLVTVTSADGSVYLFDGDKMSSINANLSAAATHSEIHKDPSGTATDDADGPSNVQVFFGRTQSDSVTLTNGGPLPDLKGQSGQLDSAGSVLSSAGLDFAAKGALVGDRVRLASPPAGCQSTTGGIAIIAAIAAGRLTLDPGLGLTCDASSSASLSATFDVDAPAPGGAAADTYVVTGSTNYPGLLGRVHPGETFTLAGTQFLALGAPPSPAALQFTMGPGDRRDGASYQILMGSGYSPFLFSLPLNTTALLLTMPGAVAFDPRNRYFYAGYQGGGALVELNPSLVRSGDATSGTAVYR